MVRLSQPVWCLGPALDPERRGYVFVACDKCGRVAVEEEIWPPRIRFDPRDLTKWLEESAEEDTKNSIRCPGCGVVYLDHCRFATSREIQDAGFRYDTREYE